MAMSFPSIIPHPDPNPDSHTTFSRDVSSDSFNLDQFLGLSLTFSQSSLFICRMALRLGSSDVSFWVDWGYACWMGIAPQ